MTIADMLNELCSEAQAEGRNTLFEHELYNVLRFGGLNTPDFYLIPNDGSDIAEHIRLLSGERVVIKIESPFIIHKTEAGGVAVCANNVPAIDETVKTMLRQVRERVGEESLMSVRYIMVAQYIDNDVAIGSELFVGMRFAQDMGHVIAIGLGGLAAEEYAARFRQGEATVTFSPTILDAEQALEKFRKSFAYRRMMGKTRGATKRCDDSQFLDVIEFFRTVATGFSNSKRHKYIVKDFEINPFFVRNGAIVAVDAFLRFEEAHKEERVVDICNLARLMKPATVAIVGVSNKTANIGRIILDLFLRENFPREGLALVHPEAKQIAGIPCVPSISDLPFVADFLVLAVAAEAVSGMIGEILASEKAHAILLIAGGMGETEWGRETEREILNALEERRAAGKPTPVVVGPNCMGVRSRPGRYDTLFVPAHKLPLSEGHIPTVALVSQSGAFLMTRLNLMPMLDCPYCVSTGNQMDLTFVDFVEYLASQDSTPTIGVYIEGFKDLDGQRLANIIKKGRTNGKDFVVYKAGRTPEGASATSSHTASISGDYISCAEILKDAGALVANSFSEFRAFLTMGAMLHDKHFGGRRLAGSSNAGFEVVGIADNLQGPDFTLAQFSSSTTEKLRSMLKTFRLEELVSLRNPLDLNGMASDAVHALSIEVVLQDENVDAYVLCLVPYSPFMKTLAPGLCPNGNDDFSKADSVPGRLAGLTTDRTNKPVVAVVDAGSFYDPFALEIERVGIPCFRSCDFAMRVFQKYISYKLGPGK